MLRLLELVRIFPLCSCPFAWPLDDHCEYAEAHDAHHHVQEDVELVDVPQPSQIHHLCAHKHIARQQESDLWLKRCMHGGAWTGWREAVSTPGAHVWDAQPAALDPKDGMRMWHAVKAQSSHMLHAQARHLSCTHLAAKDAKDHGAVGIG